jgi:hypothetical protein
MTLRRHLIDLLSAEPRSVSSLARELGLPRGDIAEKTDDRQHCTKPLRGSL